MILETIDPTQERGEGRSQDGSYTRPNWQADRLGICPKPLVDISLKKKKKSYGTPDVSENIKRYLDN